VGFFSKIFGGKKADTGEIQTVSGEQAVVEDPSPQKLAPEAEPIPEEDRVPEPEPQPEPQLQPQPQAHAEPETKSKGKGKHKHKGRDGSDHKPTVFGMAAPTFTPPADTASGEVTSGEMVSGTMAAGEMELESAGEPVRSEASGSMVVGGEVTLGQTSSGEIMMDEVSVAAPVVMTEAAGEIPSTDEPAEPVSAIPTVPAAATDSGSSGPVARTSGARPAILDDEDHADVELFPKAAVKKDARSTIDCVTCHHRLPVPYVGYPARITCPFCLNVNEYNM